MIRSPPLPLRHGPHAHARDDDAVGIDRVIERHPALRRHAPARLKGWVGETDQ